jgi:hypothetical protein
MKLDDDGSPTIYIQRDSPGKEKESNWLPARTSGASKLALRLYISKKQVADGNLKPPVVRAK